MTITNRNVGGRMRTTIDIPVKICLGCGKTYNRVIRRSCNKCMRKILCMAKSTPSCTDICNKCWRLFENVARAVHYRDSKDGWRVNGQ